MKFSLESVITNNDLYCSGRKDSDRVVGKDVTHLYYKLRQETEREIQLRLRENKINGVFRRYRCPQSRPPMGV
jgi:hypothetical protein